MSSLAASRADGYYYPRNFDPQKHNTLAQHNKEKGITKGKASIRFEMMFNVRCLGCQQSIGKGVRFNARKSKVGEYLGTTIWAFEMTCHLCSHKFVIKTDPENTSFAI